MRTTELERHEDLERRVKRIEDVLPTLATKDDLKREIGDAENRLRTEIGETEDRLRTEIGDAVRTMRTHFDVVTESLRDDIRLVAEAVATLAQRDK